MYKVKAKSIFYFYWIIIGLMDKVKVIYFYFYWVITQLTDKGKVKCIFLLDN